MRAAIWLKARRPKSAPTRRMPRGHEPTMEDAFIAIVEESRASGYRRGKERRMSGSDHQDRAVGTACAASSALDPQGDTAGVSRPEQHRGRHRHADGPAGPVRLRTLVRRQKRSRRARDGGLIRRRNGRRFRLQALGLFRRGAGQDDGGGRTAAPRQGRQRDRPHPRPTSRAVLELGDAEIQVVVHGTDANTARISLGYAQGAIGTWLAREAARGRFARRRFDQSSRTGCGSTRPTRARTFWSRASSCWS